MNGLVVDASITMTWCYPDEHNHYAYQALDILEHTQAVVPALWSLEVSNALVIGERRQRLSSVDVTRFFELLKALSIHVDSETAARAFSDTLPLARAYRLSVYDASYLELAIREGLVLATLDMKLQAAAQAAGVSVF